jgi:hypothetical protein
VSIKSNSATTANVSSSASVTILAANSAATGRAVFNDSTAALYLKYGTTASTTDYTVKINAGGYFEFPQPGYRGRVDGIWASANGSAQYDRMVRIT